MFKYSLILLISDKFYMDKNLKI